MRHPLVFRSLTASPLTSHLTTNRRAGPRRRRGAISALSAFLLVVMVIAAAFMVDTAYMKLAKTQLQSATDAAARAAGSTLGSAQDMDLAREAAIAVGLLNEVAGVPLQLTSEDIVFGNSARGEDGTFAFTAGGTPTNGVQIVGRRQIATDSGPVPLFMGSILGREYFEPVATSVVTRLDRDICVVVDRSGSMAWDLSNVEWSYPAEYHNRPLEVNYTSPPHPTLSRWAALVGAVDEFVVALNNTDQSEKVSLVSFAHQFSGYGITQPTVRTEQNMTFDYSLFSTELHEIGQNPICGGTNIGAGIERGRQILTNAAQVRPFAFKTMVVMTDGNWNEGANPVTTAQTAANNNIQIHTITFSDEADQELMKEVARVGNGLHIHADTAEALEAAFRKIAYTLPVVITQ